MLNYDFYDFMKLMKVIGKKNTPIVNSIKPYYIKGNNFVSQFLLIDDKLIKLLTYSIKIKKLMWEKKYDQILKEVVEFIESNHIEYQNNFGTLFYILIKIFIIKKDKVNAIEYNTKLNTIYFEDARYNPKCLYYMGKCRKIVTGNIKEYHRYLKNGLFSFILRNNITQLYYYTILSFRALIKDDYFKLKKLKHVKNSLDIEKCSTIELELKNNLDYKNLLYTLIYINHYSKEIFMKIKTYEKINLNESIILKVYVEKIDDKYVCLKKFCHGLSIKEKVCLISKIVSKFNDFHKNFIILNTLSPYNIMIKSPSKIYINHFSNYLNSIGDEYLNPKEKYGISIRYLSRSAALFNISEFNNDFYSMVMILYEIIYEEEPWKDLNNDEIIEKLRQNSEFFDHNNPIKEISNENHEIIKKIILNYSNHDKSKIFDPILEMNIFIEMLRKIN